MKKRYSLIALSLLLAACTSSPTQTTQQTTSPASKGEYLYVFNGLGKTIDEVNLKTREVKSLMRTGLYPNQFVPSGDMTYLVNSGDHSIDKLDLKNRRLLDVVSLPIGSNPMSLTPYGDNKGFVVNYGTNDVAWLNLDTRALEATASVPNSAPGGAVAITNGKAYVSATRSNYDAGTKTFSVTYSCIHVYDVATRALLKTIALDNADDNPGVSVGDASVDPNGKVQVGVKNGIVVIDPTTDTITRRIDFGVSVGSMRYVSATKAYAATYTGMLSYNPTTYEILRGKDNPIPSGGGPFKIHGGAAYVANFGADAIRVIDLATETASGSDIPVGDGPQDLVFMTVDE